MSERVLVINTHPDKNPDFVGKLVQFLDSVGIQPEVIEGYENINPLHKNPTQIILTGVPIDANYSLTEEDTQKVVEKAFRWLEECDCPILGICYGHQILAHLFGGKIASLDEMVKDERLSLAWKPDHKSGIFDGVGKLTVFAEHLDYVSEIPEDFTVLCEQDGIPYIIYHPEKRIYGVQFVPEQSDDRTKEILKQFLGR